MTGLNVLPQARAGLSGERVSPEACAIGAGILAPIVTLLRELQSAAKARGYLLAQETMTVNSGGGSSPVTLQPGDLLLPTRQLVHISVSFDQVTLSLVEKPPFLDQGIPDADLHFTQESYVNTEVSNVKIIGDAGVVADAERRLALENYRSYVLEF